MTLPKWIESGIGWLERPAGVLAAAVVLRLLLLVVIGAPDPFIGDDQQDYLGLRDRILSTGYFTDSATGMPTAFRDPGYPYWLAALAVLGVRDVLAIVLVQIVLSGLAGALLVRLAGLEWGARAARCTGLLFLAHIPFATYAFMIYPETLFVTTLALLLLGLQSWVRNRTVRNQCLVGLLVAAALLTRFAASLGLVLLVGSVLLTAGRHRVSSWLLIVMIPMVAVSAWCWRNYQDVGIFAPNTSGAVNLHLGNNALGDGQADALRPGQDIWAPLNGLNEAERPARSVQLAVDYFRTHPVQAIQQLLIKVPKALEFDRMFIGVSRRGQFPRRPALLLLAIGGLAALAAMAPSVACAAAALRPMPGWLWRGSVAFCVGIVIVELMTVAHSRYSIPGWLVLLPAGGLFVSRAPWPERRDRLCLLIAAVVLAMAWAREILTR